MFEFKHQHKISCHTFKRLRDESLNNFFNKLMVHIYTNSFISIKDLNTIEKNLCSFREYVAITKPFHKEDKFLDFTANLFKQKDFVYIDKKLLNKFLNKCLSVDENYRSAIFQFITNSMSFKDFKFKEHFSNIINFSMKSMEYDKHALVFLEAPNFPDFCSINDLSVLNKIPLKHIKKVDIESAKLIFFCFKCLDKDAHKILPVLSYLDSLDFYQKGIIIEGIRSAIEKRDKNFFDEVAKILEKSIYYESDAAIYLLSELIKSEDLNLHDFLDFFDFFYKHKDRKFVRNFLKLCKKCSFIKHKNFLEFCYFCWEKGITYHPFTLLDKDDWKAILNNFEISKRLITLEFLPNKSIINKLKSKEVSYLDLVKSKNLYNSELNDKQTRIAFSVKKFALADISHFFDKNKTNQCIQLEKKQIKSLSYEIKLLLKQVVYPLISYTENIEIIGNSSLGLFYLFPLRYLLRAFSLLNFSVSRIESSKMHNNLKYINRFLLDRYQFQRIMHNKELVLVLDASVFGKPSSFIGYENYFNVINSLILGKSLKKNKDISFIKSRFYSLSPNRKKTFSIYNFDLSSILSKDIDYYKLHHLTFETTPVILLQCSLDPKYLPKQFSYHKRAYFDDFYNRRICFNESGDFEFVKITNETVKELIKMLCEEINVCEDIFKNNF